MISYNLAGSLWQLARAGARCDYGIYAGASKDNAQQLPSLAREAVALKMYLNETFTTLRMDSMADWMQVCLELWG